MPFTAAHPAVILPLLRSKYFSASGLIIGSLSPDFEYFFKMTVSGAHGHTKAGLFYFDLPVTLILALIFHLIVKNNLIKNLPVFFQQRFQDTVKFDFIEYIKSHWHIFIISALVGAASHVFWDSFTHNNRYFVRQFSSVYKHTSVPFNGIRYPLFYVLQQVSTVVGSAFVCLYILSKKPAVDGNPTLPKVSYWILVTVIAIIVLLLRFYIRHADFDLGNVVVSSISGFLIGLVCCGFINFKNISFSKSLDG